MSSTRFIRRGLLLSVFFVAFGLFLFSVPAFASPLDDIRKGIIPKCDWAAGETYGLGAFTQLALNILKFIWGILGSLALVMFVWGGFLWLTARGEENQIKQGWDTLVNAVIGLLIVLGSWLIINTIILALTNPGQWQLAQVFSQPWTDLVGENICVNVAAHVKSTGIGKGIVGSAAVGGCCYQSPEVTFKSGDLDACKELALSGIDEVYYCHGVTKVEGCGNVTPGTLGVGGRFGAGGPSTWNINCGGKQKVEAVDKEQACTDSGDVIKVCKDGVSCITRFGNDPRTFCIDESEEKGKCLLFYDLTDLSDVTKKETAIDSTDNKTRLACKQLSVKSGDGAIKGGFSTRYEDRLFCSNAISGISPGWLQPGMTIIGAGVGCGVGAVITWFTGGILGCPIVANIGGVFGATVGGAIQTWGQVFGNDKCIKP